MFQIWEWGLHWLIVIASHIRGKSTTQDDPSTCYDYRLCIHNILFRVLSFKRRTLECPARLGLNTPKLIQHYLENTGRRCHVSWCQRVSIVNRACRRFAAVAIGSFSNDDGDGNEIAETAIGFLGKTTSLHVNHAFWLLYLPLLHDYDMKMSQFLF